MRVYRGFSVPIFEDSPGASFPPIARGAPILLGFLQFMGLLEPRFLGDFSPPFSALLPTGLRLRSPTVLACARWLRDPCRGPDGSEILVEVQMAQRSL
jgi:hypothetical protein